MIDKSPPEDRLALVAGGAPRGPVLNRTFGKAQALAEAMGAGVEAVDPGDADQAFASNTAVINATSTILSQAAETYPLDKSPPGAVTMATGSLRLRPASRTKLPS